MLRANEKKAKSIFQSENTLGKKNVFVNIKESTWHVKMYIFKHESPEALEGFRTEPPQATMSEFKSSE